MEEGSQLLQQALNHKKDDSLANTLLIDVYLLDCDIVATANNNNNNYNNPDLILNLSALANEWNQALLKLKYPWSMGGDGPVFGIHYSFDDQHVIPHLRATCVYNQVVADEWRIIKWIIEESQSYTSVAIECYDVDDGHVLLIQTAYELPAWVDEDGPDDSRHACWIRNGQVCLIEPMLKNSNDRLKTPCALTISDALTCLQSNSSIRVCILPSIQNAIKEKLDSMQAQFRQHKTALALPRVVAVLFQRRPDMLAVAVNAFVQYANETFNASSPTKLDSVLTQDWVWTTARLSRPTYAMLAHFAAHPNWTVTAAVGDATNSNAASNSQQPWPRRYHSAELQRINRQGQSEMTPHLKHGALLGVRIVAGLDYSLQVLQREKSSPRTTNSMNTTERHIMHNWANYLRKLQKNNDDCDPAAWLIDAWKAGPQHANYDIDQVLKCPVYDSEIHNHATPISYPDIPSWPLHTSIELAKAAKIVNNPSDNNQAFPLPRANDVDNDEWMQFPDGDDELERQANITPSTTTTIKSDKSASHAPKTKDDGSNVAREMLQSLENFTVAKSDLGGVETIIDQPINIDPVVFLNLFHAVLKAETVDEIPLQRIANASKPSSSKDLMSSYFLPEDYEDDSSDSDGELDAGVLESMQDMEDELTENYKNVSRHAHSSQNHHDDMNTLSNLLMSLQASSGTPGPLNNMLREMGIEPPDVQLDDD